MRKVWFGLVAVVVAVIGAFGVLSTGSEAADPEDAGLPSVEKVAQRVEALRGLRFEQQPRVAIVTAKQLNGELRKLDRAAAKELEGNAKRRAEALSIASNAVTGLSGLVPEDQLDDTGGGSSEGGSVLGLYLPERKRVFVVRELAEKDPKLAEAVLAHELNHALEDQKFGGLERESKPFAEASFARHAFFEGTATLIELEYRAKHLGDDRSLEQMIEEEVRARLGERGAPPGLNVLSQFPYADGATFVRALHRQGGWKQVDQAARRPPATSSAILNPEKWPTDRQERPRFSLSGALSDEWTRLGRADLGEVDTLAILASGLPLDQARKAAEGWSAGRFEAWVHEDVEDDCEGTCRESFAAALVWKMDDEGQQEELSAALKAALQESIDAQPSGDVMKAGKGFAAQAARGDVSVLAFAPSAAEAKRVAAEASR